MVTFSQLLCCLISTALLALMCLPASAVALNPNANAAVKSNGPDYKFIAPSDKAWREFEVEYGFAPKQWSLPEKQTVTHVLNQIRAAHPEFFARAVASCRPLGLIRRHMTADDNRDHRGRPVCLLTGVSTIEVDDSFFRTPSDFQVLAVTHELGHLLDTACIFSTSQAFLSVAQPILTRVHRLYGNQPYAPNDVELMVQGEEVARRAGLPTLDAAENLAEAFADCVAYYLVEGPKSVSAPVQKYIRQYVLKPDAKIEHARRLYVGAELATDDGDFDTAFRDLNDLLVEQPSMLDVHACRARIWGFKHDFEMMAYEAHEELALLQRRHIPRYHGTYERASDLLASAHEHVGFARQ